MKNIILISKFTEPSLGLTQAGIKHSRKTPPAHYTQSLPGANKPQGLVNQATFWLENIAKGTSTAIHLAASSALYYRNQVLPHPQFKMDAFDQIKSFQGTSHEVSVGFAVKSGRTGKTLSGLSTTRVFLSPLTPDEIEGYVNDHDVVTWPAPYSLLHSPAARFITRLDGSYTTAVYYLPIPEILDSIDRVSQA